MNNYIAVNPMYIQLVSNDDNSASRENLRCRRREHNCRTAKCEKAERPWPLGQTLSQSYGFSSHIWMWELDYKESWVPNNWCFWTIVVEDTFESPLDCKEIHPVHPKGNQSWIFIGRTDAEAEAPIVWPPDVKNWLIWKDPDAGKDWRREEKGRTEDEVVGWHHRLNWHEFE